MVALTNKMEISLPDQFLKDRGLTLASLLNPTKLQETLHQFLPDVPSEYRPVNSKISLGSMSDGYIVAYELSSAQIGCGLSEEEVETPKLDINGELDVEMLLDQAIFAVNENRYCRKQTLTFNDTPVSFVREYLENEDCQFFIRVLNPHLFEVTITPNSY